MRSFDRPRLRQRGLTLVELMVAITLGLLVTGAAIATLLIARQGFTSVDGSTQLRENARFAASLIERIAAESGFENAAYGLVSTTKLPGVRGYDNSLWSAASSLPSGLAHGTRTASNCGSVTDTACPTNASDVLLVRFWGASRNGAADQSMINCAGVAEPEQGLGAEASDPRAYSIFHVQAGADGEPALACTYRDPADVTGGFKTVSLVQGVESFQVLYGAFGVTPGVCSAAIDFAAQVAPGNDGSNQFFTASQLDGAGTYCANNWARVRTIRVGLLLRGAPSTAVTRATKTWNVLGDAAAAASTMLGNTQVTTPADGRFRQQLVFTINLRNAQFAP